MPHIRLPVSVVALLLSLVPWPAAAKLRGPLPLEAAMTVHLPSTRSSFNLSPDGQWLAHTVLRTETVPGGGGGSRFTATGFPLTEGDSLTQAMLTNVKTGDAIRLGGDRAASWAPVWSPDGKHVAFYADDDGEAGIWIWEKASGRTDRFPDVIARPAFGFEFIRWSKDSRRLIAKILPEGLTIAQANALIPSDEAPNRFPKVAADKPSVFVLKHDPKAASPSIDAVPADARPNLANSVLADLAILDVRTRRATRVAKRARATWYAFSPDETMLAFNDLLGPEPNAPQSLFNLKVMDLPSGIVRTVAERAPLSYGIGINWSPDSKRIAYVRSGPMTQGELVVVSALGGSTVTYDGEGMPNLDATNGELPPLWDASGRAIYAIGQDDQLWRIDVATGRGTIAGRLPNRQITAIIARASHSTIWTTDGGRGLWVTAREKAGPRSGLYRIDSVTGESRAMLEDMRHYTPVFNLDANERTGDIAYVATDQQHPQDVWIYNTRTRRNSQVSHLNPKLERYALGEARTIAWRGADGRALRGALLLPHGYKPGRRLPLVLWVYGGMNGSDYVNSFGFWGEYSTFNMHILASRGYAVLFPDAPLETGRTLRGLADTVLPGVEAAIEQGYADPDRLAVMGQSYGSFSTLALITQTKRFRAAIITGAVVHPDIVSDYLTMMPDGMAGTGFYEMGQGNMGGTLWEYPERYRENSPIWLFDQIETPLLIGQGTQDFGRGTASDAIFVALKRLNKSVEYRLYENEGHVITRTPNVLDFWTRRLDFLAEHLDIVTDSRGMIVFKEERARSRRAGRGPRGDSPD